jgi:hypothetical protein
LNELENFIDIKRPAYLYINNLINTKSTLPVSSSVDNFSTSAENIPSVTSKLLLGEMQINKRSKKNMANVSILEYIKSPAGI